MKRLAETWDGCNLLQHLGNRRVLYDSKSGDVEELTRRFDSSICQENELMLLKRVQIPMVKSLTSAAKDSMVMGACILAGKDLMRHFESSNIFRLISKHHKFTVTYDLVSLSCLTTLFLPGQNYLVSDSGAGQAAAVTGKLVEGAKGVYLHQERSTQSAFAADFASQKLGA